jgi:UPF0755 protein
MSRLRPVAGLATIVLGVVAATLAAGIAAAIWSIELPYKGFQAPTFVKFERGSGTPAMARVLAQTGVIRYSWQFLLARALNPSVNLQAGEYRFTTSASVRGILHRIAAGDVYYFDLSVPEGSNMFDIARSLDAQDATSGFLSGEDFLRAAANPALIHDLDPAAPTLEGYLFPATYRLSRSTTAEELCKMMTAQFRRQWKKLAGGERAEPHRAVTLASMVEKETGLASERALVAGVFVNRLQRGMNLACDPTTIYAALLEHRYRGAIHRSDLDNRNPYNTYKNPGLPPGAIANPGAESIAAALKPAETDYLYFVAKPAGGGHQFSSTLAAHEKAVQEYRNGSQVHATKTGKAG